MLYFPSTNKYLNQCDMVEKRLDLGLEDLIKVCPGTNLCEVGKYTLYLLYLPGG